MKGILLLIFLFPAVLHKGYCAGVNDNLSAIIRSSSGTARIEALNELSRNYTILARPDSALMLAQSALRESKMQNCYVCMADSYISLYFYAYYYDESKTGGYYRSLMDVSVKSGYSRGMAYSFVFSSDLVADSSVVASYLYLDKAINLFEIIGDSEGLAFAYWRMGDLFLFRPDYTQAIKYLVEAIRIFDRKRPLPGDIYNRYHYSMICNSLGIAYKNTGDYSKSKHYYNMYLEESKAIGEMWGVAIAYNNLGNLELNAAANDKALEYYNKSMKIWIGLGITDYHGELYLNLGNAYMGKGEYTTAAACFDSSFRYSSVRKSNAEIAKILACRGNLLAIQEKYAEAIDMFNKSIELVKQGNQLKILSENYQALAAVYDSLGNYKKAYYFFQLYNSARDSLFSSEKAKEVGLLTANYEIQKKIEERKRENELAQKREEEEIRRRNTLQYSGITIFIAALFTFIIISGKFRISDTALEVVVFVSLLLLFEFIQVMCDPLINKITGSEPFYLLLANLAIVGAIIPLDAYLEKLMNNRLKKKQ